MKKQNGITLIVLVITIIVLLILAGVTIATVVGEQSMVAKAQTSVKKTVESEVIEQIKLELYDKEIEKREELTDEEIIEVIKSYDKDGEIKKNSYIETQDGKKSRYNKYS